MKIRIVHQPKIDPSFQRIAIPAGMTSKLRKLAVSEAECNTRLLS
ncbi:Ribosomal protein S4 or related protein [Pseudomonas syringae pv. actinidiae]|uniref:Ribosomal protein S4 or related protein n=1 Tax=Pseudomonas syringae pv. actinidiae TaxID=103796 RepID=A0A2V0QSJ0_PSESF|nr:Ribosomal protein S4 or related protein [Pseudomonas syringae pv. actinidiae]